MKREIKFRAKAINDDFFKGVWVDGYYTKRLWNEKLVDIITDGAHEIPIQIETLGQFTGLRDRNGVNCVFEGDILSLHGTLIGNIYENKDLLKDETNFVINGLCTKEWCYTYQEAIKRGCVDAK